MVKMNAWRNATKSSSVIMKSESGMAAAAPAIEPPTLVPALPNMKIKPTKHMITMCPAVMFAKSRSSKVKGLRNKPSISTGVRIRILSAAGTPGIQSVCSQKYFLVLASIRMKVNMANTMVTERLPVTLALPGKKGICPMRLSPRIKKNADKR